MAAPSSTDFIQSVWECLGATGPTDFARKLSLGPDGLQKVRRWRLGGRIDYEDVMVMLERCGWLNMDATSRPEQTSPPVPLEELAESMTDVLANQRTMMEQVQRLVEQADTAPVRKRAVPKRRRA